MVLMCVVTFGRRKGAGGGSLGGRDGRGLSIVGW